MVGRNEGSCAGERITYQDLFKKKLLFALMQPHHLLLFFGCYAFSPAPPNVLVDFKRLAASVCHYKHSFSHRPEWHFFLSDDEKDVILSNSRVSAKVLSFTFIVDATPSS